MNNSEERSGSPSTEKEKIRERYVGVDQSKIETIPARPKEDIFHPVTRKRVAVYARVSTDDPRQTSSYELQKNHYTDMVASRDDWDLADIYADEGISGTSLQHRDAFIRMINDCRAGKIDLIVTKSVSRFARNIMDCIGYSRILKGLDPPVGILFETEGIFTLNENSEMSLAFIATIMQEESHTKSEIMNSSIEMRNKRGIFLTPVLLGYDQDENGNLIINEEEAKTVRLIFYLYLDDHSIPEIVEILNQMQCITKRNNIQWSYSTVKCILTNERHCGDVLARKTWTPNYLDHKSKKNNQDRNQYYQREHHEAIISRDDFLAVQRKLLENSRSGSNILPILSVIKTGALKGFVPINTKWNAFTVQDYIAASNSVEQKDEDFKQEITVAEGDYDLSGFEVVHGEYFESSGKPVLQITGTAFKANSIAVNDYPDSEYTELLIHPARKILAIRQSQKANRYSLKWASTREGKKLPRIVNDRIFLPKLFQLMGWQAECIYKITGYLLSKNNENVLLFDLNEPEVKIPLVMDNDEQSTIDQLSEIDPFTTRRGKSILAYPAMWKDNFGKNAYMHELTTGSNLLPNEHDGISNSSEEFLNHSSDRIEEQISPTNPTEIKEQIQQLLTEIGDKKNDADE